MRHFDLRYTDRDPWFDVRLWRKRTWATVIVVLGIITGLIVAAAVIISRALSGEKYPEYRDVGYKLESEYSGEGFFDGFSFWEGDDGTGGHVQFASREQALELNLTSATSNSAVLKVDTSRNNTTTGRPSARIFSGAISSGLVIFDIIHAPHACGIWPALRLTTNAGTPTHFHSPWGPNGGELDLMEARHWSAPLNTSSLEGASSLQTNVSMITTGHCPMDVARHQRAESLGEECYGARQGGCAVDDHGTNYFSKEFNDKGGGMVAAELRPEGVRVWRFERDLIPENMTGRSPNPSDWGEPTADFPATKCFVERYFGTVMIVLDINLCGQTAWGDVISGCSNMTCEEHVTKNPEAFETAYWELGSMKLFSPIGKYGKAHA